MKTITFIFLLSLIHVQTINAQSLEKRAIEVPDDWTKLELEGYWMIYPKSWELNSSGNTGTIFAVLSPITSPKDTFRENVNLMIQDLAGTNLSLAQFTDVSEEQIKMMLTNGKLIESTTIFGNRRNYQHVIFSGKQGVYDLIFEQYYWVEDEKAFVLTFTCEKKQQKEYKLTGQKILNSFQLF